MKTRSLCSLTRNQKEAIGLLQIGTFLEYFDLMLYVHMAVLLNELFFPKADPHTAALLSAFAFCSTFVLRPFGALLFGYLGDTIGRKSTVIITTILMALSSIVMANLPTYAQIGITAAWIITICRMVQGVASLGEIVGAEVYLTESIDKPLRYPVVSFVAVSSVLGTVAALGVAVMFTSFNMDWRIAFWIGSGIAAVGTLARTRLRETPEFLVMNRRIKKMLEAKKKKKLQDPTLMESVREDATHPYSPPETKKSTYHFLIIQCIWPVCFYFIYVYCSGTLKKFGYTSEQIIHHNFFVTIVHLVSLSMISYLSYYIHPLRILKAKAVLFGLLVCFIPFILDHVTSSIHMFVLQAVTVSLALDSAPAIPVFLSYIPVLKRFTYASFTYAVSRAMMYVITSFGLIYLTDAFGNWGLWVVFAPAVIGFSVGIRYFENLEFPDRKSRDLTQKAIMV